MPTVEYYGDSTASSLCIAPPDVCLYDLQTVRVSGVPESAWLEDATEYVLELWAPAGSGSGSGEGSGSGGGSGSGSGSVDGWDWQEVATVENPGEAAVVEGITYENGIKARWKVLTGDGTFYSDEVNVDTFCCHGSLPPETPEVPELEKDCGGPVVIVSSPEFSEVEDHETETIELRRCTLPDGDWQTVHTYESAGTWADESVEPATNYEYQARACNDAGCSDWSASATISLKSSTTVAIVSPATGTLSGRKRLRLSASGPVTNPRLFWNGVLIGVPVLKDGFYLFDWNTLDSSQGAGTLRFQATGADGCENFAEVEYTLANAAAALTNHFDIICREGVAPAGMRIKSASFRLQAEPQPASANQRYFMRAAAYLDDEGATAAFTLAFDEDTWDTGQPLLLRQGRKLDDGTTQYTWFDILAKKDVTGRRAIFRLRWDVGESLTGLSTFGADSDSRIVKFLPVGEDDEYRVLFLARKDNGSGARIYQFDGQTMELFYNLADEPYGAPGAFDFALLGDKLFVAAGSELFYIDTDSGDASANLTPRGETREIAHLATMGSSVFALFNGDDDCKCYRFNGNSWREAWTLPIVIDKAYATTLMGNAYLMLASGADLYTAVGTAVPTLAETFLDSITALHERFVGLANGLLYEFVLNEWELHANRTEAILAAAEFSGVTSEIEAPRGVAGENSDTLLEATANPAAWTHSRTLAAPALMDESVTAVTALHRFLKQTADAEGDPNMPGYVPAKFQEVLLIGTAPDGLLLMLEVNQIAQSPLAIEARNVGYIHAMPIHETIPSPVEEE